MRSQRDGTARGPLRAVGAFYFYFLLVFSPSLLADLPQTGTFNAAREFPNYFLPEQFRGTDPDQIPDTVVSASREKLEKALQSVFRNLTIPIVKPNSTKVEMVNYFRYLNEAVRQADSSATVMPSGGVVRSALGYIYNEVVEGLHANPPRSAEETLDLLIKARAGIPGYKVRGVGSDFDILLRGDKSKLAEVSKIATDITNSAEAAFGVRNFRSDLKRSLFTIGDVKEYEDQIQRSTKQGGSTLDFLAYDVEKGVFVEPSDHATIVNDFLRGIYSYIPPSSSTDVEDGAKQTIRGIRALVELPWLVMENDQQLREELKELLESVEKGKVPSAKALSQFDKTVRNARYSAGHNRIFRGAENSIEELIHRVAVAIESKTQRNTLPEFVDAFPLHARDESKAELNGLPRHLLMPVSEFVKNHTDKGTLYHGTPEIESGLAIMRGSLFISKQDGLISGGKTVAAFGRGAYSSPNKAVSRGYAGVNGVIFELAVQADKPLNILHWATAQQDPAMQAIIAKAAKDGKDVFEVLAREHGIDIILHQHVLIQNIHAVHLPSDFKGLINSYATLIDNPDSTAKARIDAYLTHQRLYQYASALGVESPRKPLSTLAFTKSLFASSKNLEETFLTILRQTDFIDELRAKLPKHPELKSQFRALLAKVESENPGTVAVFPWSLRDTEDVLELQKRIKSYPWSFSAIETEKQGIITELGQRFPHLYKVSGSHRPSNQDMKEALIPDTQLRERWNTLVQAERRSAELRDVFDSLAKQDPLAFIEHLSGSVPDFLETMAVTRSDSGWTVTSANGALHTLGNLVGRLLEKQSKRPLARLTPKEQQLVRFLVEQQQEPALRAFLSQKGRVRTDVVRLLREEATPHTVLGLLPSTNEVPSIDKPWVFAGKSFLYEEIEKTPDWKTSLRKYILDGNSTPERRTAYPWSLSDAEDVKAIQKLVRQSETASQRLIELERRIQLEEKIAPSHYAERFDSDHIRNPQLRAEYIRTREASKLSNELAPEIQERWHAKFPETFAEKFPKSPLRIKRLTYPGWDDAAWKVLKEKWGKTGYASLDSAEKSRVQELLGQAIQTDSLNFFSSLLKAGGELQQTALKRILKAGARDSLEVSAKLVKTKEHETPTKAASDRAFPRFKERLYRVLQKDGEPFAKREQAEIYPWDIKDSRDVEWLKQLVRKHPHSPYRLEWDLGASLLTRLRKVMPQLWDTHTPQIEHLDAANIVDEELANQVQSMQKALLARSEVESALEEFYRQDPKIFGREFRDSELRDLIFSGVGVSVDSGKYSVRLSGVSSATLAPHQRYLNELLEKLGSREALDSDGQFWLRELLHSKASTVTQLALTGRPEWRKIALEHLKSSASASDVFDRLSKTSDTSDRALRAQKILREAIHQDPQWKENLRQAVLTSPRESTLGSFPFDLKDPLDIALLKTVQERARGAVDRLKDLRRKVKKIDGIATDLNSPDNLNPGAITDEGLRAQFTQARNDFLLGLNLEDVQKDLQTAHPALYQRVFPDSPLNRKKTDFAGLSDVSKMRQLKNMPLTEDQVSVYQAFLKFPGAAREWAIRRLLEPNAQDHGSALLTLLNADPEVRQRIMSHPKWTALKDRLRAAQNPLEYSTGDYPWDLADPKDLVLLREWEKAALSYEVIAQGERRIETYLSLHDSDTFVKYGRQFSHHRRVDISDEDPYFTGLISSLQDRRRRNSGKDLRELIDDVLELDPKDLVSLGKKQSHFVSHRLVRELQNSQHSNLAFGIARMILAHPSDFGRYVPSRVRYSDVNSQEILEEGIREYATELQKNGTRRASFKIAHAVAFQRDPLRTALEFPDKTPENLNTNSLIRNEDGRWEIRKGADAQSAMADVLNKASTGTFANLSEGEKALLWLCARSEFGILEGLTKHSPPAVRFFFLQKLREQKVANLTLDLLTYRGTGEPSSKPRFPEILRLAIAADPRWKADLRHQILEGISVQSWLVAFPWDLRDPEDVRVLQNAYGKLQQKRETLLAVLRDLRREEGIHFSDSFPSDVLEESILNSERRAAYARAKMEYVLSNAYTMDPILEAMGKTGIDLLAARAAEPAKLAGAPVDCFAIYGMIH